MRNSSAFVRQSCAKDSSKSALREAANLALGQIDKKKYTIGIKEFHGSTILRVGIAFSGKMVYVVHQSEAAEID